MKPLLIAAIVATLIFSGVAGAEITTSNLPLCVNVYTGKEIPCDGSWIGSPPKRLCPWTHMSVPESAVDAWYAKGWEPFSTFFGGWKYWSNYPEKATEIPDFKIFIKKRICKGDKP
ncbi:hypothetical protein LCGC14_1366390 [marine sediment metagenome]|uniref:Uncharacterized protein n=1 Tax=marine sediment metagenome TaxID=412755 RepID=A0A0F9MLU6_9ZZZZ